MTRKLFLAYLGASACVVACSTHPSGQKVASISPSLLKNRIPPADPRKYHFVADARDWLNPFLVVGANGIQVRSISASTDFSTMSPSEVVGYLENLSPIAWPYGLVVAVAENGLRSSGDDARITSNREALVRLLREAGVRVESWPA
jgi:hypothetical protein